MLLVPTAAPLALTAALLALNNHSDYSFLGMRYLEETQDAAFFCLGTLRQLIALGFLVDSVMLF